MPLQNENSSMRELKIELYCEFVFGINSVPVKLKYKKKPPFQAVF